MKAIMGLFHVSATLTGPTGRTATLDLLVDTGATLLVVPRSLADQLEILALRTQPVQIAGGRKEVWPVAEVRVAINGREVTTPCFIAPGGPALLGAVALESLFLAADPVAKRLVPVEGFVGLAARRESSLSDPLQLVAERSLVPPASPPRSARAQPESPRSLRATPRAIRAASQSGCVAARKALSRSLASSQLSWA